jgi:hypothetical protein
MHHQLGNNSVRAHIGLIEVVVGKQHSRARGR